MLRAALPVTCPQTVGATSPAKSQTLPPHSRWLADTRDQRLASSRQGCVFEAPLDQATSRLQQQAERDNTCGTKVQEAWAHRGRGAWGAPLWGANIPGGGHSMCKARRQETAQCAWGTLRSSGGSGPGRGALDTLVKSPTAQQNDASRTVLKNVPWLSLHRALGEGAREAAAADRDSAWGEAGGGRGMEGDTQE